MADYRPNKKYVEAISAILVQFMVPRSKFDFVDETTGKTVDGNKEAAIQVVETDIFDGLDEKEAIQLLNSHVARHTGALSDEDRENWIRDAVNSLPPILREKTFAIYTMHAAHSNDGELGEPERKRLALIAELLGLSEERAAMIAEIACTLNRRIL